MHFAFWSCQDFTHGFYNAHDVLADEDLDFVVCLGDYIYAETEERGATAVRADRIGSTGPTARARRSRSTTTAPSTASTAPTRPCAASTPASRR